MVLAALRRILSGAAAGARQAGGAHRHRLALLARAAERRAWHRCGADRCRPQWGECSLPARRSEEHTSELQSLMRISYAVFCLKQKKKKITDINILCY